MMAPAGRLISSALLSLLTARPAPQSRLALQKLLNDVVVKFAYFFILHLTVNSESYLGFRIPAECG